MPSWGAQLESPISCLSEMLRKPLEASWPFSAVEHPVRWSHRPMKKMSHGAGAGQGQSHPRPPTPRLDCLPASSRGSRANGRSQPCHWPLFGPLQRRGEWGTLQASPGADNWRWAFASELLGRETTSRCFQKDPDFRPGLWRNPSAVGGLSASPAAARGLQRLLRGGAERGPPSGRGRAAVLLPEKPPAGARCLPVEPARLSKNSGAGGHGHHPWSCLPSLGGGTKGTWSGL
ncbi:PREDICTED: uncharacterized protein LOC102017526 [Chinchilla lanigera]|uniref:uncharacterized protein LOC102017526 n=1 Tax=Chinchilla lanigera TaxID=34839 RepID=UPI00038EFAE6|nr:PREDICTED: uncharacterized protein LOC102017526 [Chinchilla lanigera]